MKLPHKRTRFGSDAKNTLLRAGGALDTLCSDPSKYVFLTGTLPGSTSAAYTAMATHSSWIVDSLRHWLKRTCPSEYWMYVWELQKRGALHIHYCCYVPDSAIREKLIQSFPAKWRDILDSVGERSSIDMWQRSDGTTHAHNKDVLQAYAQEVKKSVAAYLAGYCGGSKDKHGMDEASPYYPVRWWGYSRKLSSLLKGLTEECISVHTNYRDARTELEQHREAVSHDTPHVHSYPHKAGSGASVISYHPQDKGNTIWQSKKDMIIQPSLYPNAASWILALQTYTQIWLNYYRALKPLKGEPYLRLLRDVEGILSRGSMQRYTLHQGDLRTVIHTVSVLSLNTLEHHNQERTLRECVPPIWMYYRVRPHLRWNRDGWLVLEKDFPVRLTDCWSLQ